MFIAYVLQMLTAYGNVCAGDFKMKVNKNVFWIVSFSLVKILNSNQLLQKSFDNILERLQIFLVTFQHLSIRFQVQESRVSGARLPTLQLTTSHSRLNSGKSLGTGCCKWLWSIATWANGTLSSRAYCYYRAVSKILQTCFANFIKCFTF